MTTVILEATLGAVAGELLRTVLDVKKRAVKFKPTLERLESILKSITPVIEEIQLYDIKLGRPKEETEKLIKHMTEGKNLLLKCSEINWWKCCYVTHYQQKLEDLEDSIRTFFDVNLQAQIARDQRQTLSKVIDIYTEIAKLNMVPGNDRLELSGRCSAPEAPQFTVGLDVPLRDLKLTLLQVGVSVTVVTGLGGSGKTTLAKMLCWDEEVKGKFKDNIFFITFSKTPNLNIIVQKLYQHNSSLVPQLQSDEDAINQLGNLLKAIGNSPILLVLDDVWPGSESLVEKFLFQMPDYKILVTSKFRIQRFGGPYFLKPLNDEDATELFRHSAFLKDSSCDIPDDLVRKIVSGCSGSPLALTLTGRSLCQQHLVVWQSRAMALSRGQSILDSNADLLACLQKSFDVPDTKAIIKECFMDLGLFPEDQRIAAAALVDMWTEMHDEDDLSAMEKIYELANRNMADIIEIRKVASGPDNYNHHFVTQHDLLRDLAIYQSSQEPETQRNRLIININGNNRPAWWTRNEGFPVAARILSISTDEVFASDWCNMQPINVEVLVLNLQAKKYTLPTFMKKMGKLKVLIVRNYGYYPSDLENFKLLGSLSNLKRIRLEQVSIPSLGETRLQLKNLKKLSLFMCNMNETFKNFAAEISDMLPNLVEINIDYCNMEELPSGVCNIVCLKKISITNCHDLPAVPEGIGKLVNLELLRLSSCTDLEVLPDSVRNLQKLKYLDVSDCISLIALPDHMGELCNLEKLYMKGCSRLRDLPPSVMDLKSLREVLCDEETVGLWESFQTMLTGLKIEVTKTDITIN